MKHRLFGGMQAFTTGLSTTLLLILLGTTVLFVLAAHNLSRSVRENLIVTVLLDDDMNSKEGERMTDILRTEQFVATAEYISKEQAMAEQSVAMGINPNEFLDTNPFNASIEMHLNADYACTDSILKITRKLKAAKHVSDVICQRDLVERITDVLQRAGYVLLGLATLLTIISFTLIANTVRLSIHTRRHLIHTMRLVGASWGFIRRPFVTHSLWLGVVSGLVSVALVVGAAKGAISLDPTLEEYIGGNTLLIVGAAVMAAGILLTLVCSVTTVNRYLYMPHRDMF